DSERGSSRAVCCDRRGAADGGRVEFRYPDVYRRHGCPSTARGKPQRARAGRVPRFVSAVWSVVGSVVGRSGMSARGRGREPIGGEQTRPVGALSPLKHAVFDYTARWLRGSRGEG